MEAQKITSDLPDLYEALLPDFMRSMVPRETFATCHECPKCLKKDRQPLPGMSYFQPETKCCSYHPTLPNYLVGSLLIDTQPGWEEGRRRLRDKIDKRIGVTPRGINPPAKYRLLYDRRESTTRGNGRSLLCPYFHQESGGCTVWPIREAACSTYFCHSVTGKSGTAFWESLGSYLSEVEEALVSYVLLQLNCDPEAIFPPSEDGDDLLSSDDMDDLPPSEEDYKKLWGELVGKEEQFYQEAHRIVTRLKPEEFDKLGGVKQQVHLGVMEKKRREMLNPDLPNRLRFDTDIHQQPMPHGAAMLIKNGVPLKLSREQLEILALFDGERNNDEVRQAWNIYRNDHLEAELIINLFNHEILVPVAEAEEVTHDSPRGSAGIPTQ